MLPAAAASTDGEVLPGQSTVAGLAASNSVLSCQDDQLLCTSFKRKCFTATLRKLRVSVCILIEKCEKDRFRALMNQAVCGFSW